MCWNSLARIEGVVGVWGVPQPERIDVQSLDRHRDNQPPDYHGANVVYLVEWETPDGDPDVVQLGAFTTMEEAERLIAYEAAAPYSKEHRLHIDTVAVHERLEDWL